MPLIVKANPFRCRMWDWHDRLESCVNETTCSSEIRSVATHGQLVAALARPLRTDPDYDFELIYGARRLFIARHLNIEILLDVQDVSDQHAVVAMDIENRQRKDISAYERGMSYARWLRSGLFSSQEELARKLKNSPATVCRLLKLATLPTVIVEAFQDATTIRESWGVALADAAEDPGSRARIIAHARTLRGQAHGAAPEEIYRCLLQAAAPGRRARLSSRVEVVKDEEGAPLFRVKHQRKSVAFVFQSQWLSQRMLESMRGALRDVLRHEMTQRIERTGSLNARHRRQASPSGATTDEATIG